jgi:hypothetical protein
MFSARCISACLRRIRLRCEFSASLVLMVTATSLVAAPPEPIQKPVKLLGLGEGIDGEFAKLTDVGIIPSLGYYSVFQGNPVGSALLVSSPSSFSPRCRSFYRSFSCQEPGTPCAFRIWLPSVCFSSPVTFSAGISAIMLGASAS